jgi:hypothetical protein
VDPEPGEDIGDPAPICATWRGIASARAAEGAAAAAASGGEEAFAEATDRPYTASASTASVAFVSIVPFDSINSGERIPLGRQLELDGTASGANDSAEFSQTLSTKVGDRILVSVAAACAAAAPGGSTATASASSEITLRLGTCEPTRPITPVPTLSQWSLLLTALLLSGLGYVGLRRQQKR